MLRDIAKNINDNVFFLIMVNKVNGTNNNEQLAVSIRWADNNFEAHEDFIGIRAVENIKSNTLVSSIVIEGSRPFFIFLRMGKNKKHNKKHNKTQQKIDCFVLP